MRLFLKFEFAPIFREAASATAAASKAEAAKGSTAMECERCFSMEVELGGGIMWMEGVAPMKGEVPAGKKKEGKHHVTQYRWEVVP